MASTTFSLSVGKVLDSGVIEGLEAEIRAVATQHGLNLSVEVVEPSLTYKVGRDEDPQNPREDWDNLGVMFCKHHKYTLGDKDADDPHEEVEGAWVGARWLSVGELDDGDDEPMRAARENIEVRNVLHDSIAICLPLYLYDHSGITISHGKFSCSWDSGQVGWHYVTKKKLQDEFGGDVERATKCLEAELKTYDAFLEGAVWGYTVEDEEGDEVASCWGFYGATLEETGILQDVAAEHVAGLTEAWDRRFE